MAMSSLGMTCRAGAIALNLNNRVQQLSKNLQVTTAIGSSLSFPHDFDIHELPFILESIIFWMRKNVRLTTFNDCHRANIIASNRPEGRFRLPRSSE